MDTALTWTQSVGLLLAFFGALGLLLMPLSRRAHVRALAGREIVEGEVTRFRRERDSESERNDRPSADDVFTAIVEYTVAGHRYQIPSRSRHPVRGQPGAIVLVAYLPSQPSDAIEAELPEGPGYGCAGVLIAAGLVLLGLSLGLGLNPLD